MPPDSAFTYGPINNSYNKQQSHVLAAFFAAKFLAVASRGGLTYDVRCSRSFRVAQRAALSAKRGVSSSA
jgi:hypothetical protein